MKLSPAQRKTLQSYQALRAHGGSIRGQLRFNRGIYLYLLIVALLLVPLGFLLGDGAGFLAMGAILGLLMRDFRFYRRTKQVWPAVEAVLDWPRIQELLNDAD